VLEGYAEVANSALQPLTQIHTDPVRARIDELVLRAIRIRGALAPLRKLIAADPLFTRAAENEDEGDDGEDEENANED
jgi:hypothetical protein